MSSQRDGDVDRTPTDRVDVCIVGAGPSGALIAAELSAAGHDVVVLDAGPRFEPRTGRGRWRPTSGPGTASRCGVWATSGTPTARPATATTR